MYVHYNHDEEVMQLRTTLLKSELKYRYKKLDNIFELLANTFTTYASSGIDISHRFLQISTKKNLY